MEDIIIAELNHYREKKGKISYEELKVYLNLLLKVRDIELRYYFFSELVFWELWNPKIAYAEYYSNRRRILDSIAGELNAGKGKDIKKDVMCKSVVILAYTLLDKMYSVGMVVLNIANEFLRQGWKVKVIIENHFVKSKYNSYCFPKVMLENSKKYREFHDDGSEKDVYFYYADNKDLAQNILDCLEAVDIFTPNLVLDLSDECSILSYYLNQKYLVYNMPMRSGKGSSMYFDKILCADVEDIVLKNQKYHWFQEKCIVSYNPGITTIPKCNHRYVKKNVCGNNACFCMVTVGSRFESDLETTFFEKICELLSRNKNICWILVGGNLPAGITEKYRNLIEEKKIIDYGVENDLIALYQICDIYINPCREGGGLSVAWAMYVGLPVAMLYYPSDGMIWIGRKNVIRGGEENLIQYIQKMSCNKNFYNKERKKFIDRAKEITITKCVESIISIWRKDNESFGSNSVLSIGEDDKKRC